MYPTDHIKKLRDIGVMLALHNDDLKVTGSTKNLTPDLVEEIRENKQELVAFLKKATANSLGGGIKKASKKSNYAMAQQQETLHLIHTLDPLSVSYNLPACYEFTGRVDIDKIESTFQLILERHDSLRTYFEQRTEGTVQCISEAVDFKVERWETDEVESYDQIIADFIRPFDLQSAPMLRVKVVQFGTEKGLFLFDTHHIVVDGRSQELIFMEFLSLYNGQELDPVQFQFVDYSEWKESTDFLQRYEQQKTYWLKEYQDHVDYLTFNKLNSNSNQSATDGGFLSCVLGKDEVNQIDQTAQRLGVTRFAMLFSVYSAFLYLITRERKFAIGTPSNGRTHQEWDRVVGMFVNTMAIKVDVDNGLTFEDLVIKTSSKISSALENQNFPVEEIAKTLNIPVEKGKSPLFNTWFFYNESFDGKIQLGELTLDKYTHHPKSAKWDLSLECLARNNELEFVFGYAGNAFSLESINYYSELFTRLIKSVSNDSSQALSDIALLSQAELEAITVDFNRTEKAIDTERTVVDLILDTATNSPEETAVKFGNESISYFELNRRSDAVANYLIDQGLSHGSIVGIMMERSIEFVTTMLGVLKSGAGYLPVNPSDPNDRKAFILNNSNCKLLVTDPDLMDTIEVDNIKVITPDQFTGQNELTRKQSVNLSKAGETAYIIYTSGTTGQPKGVNVAHQSLHNYVNWATDQYVNDERSDFALYTSVFFDMVITSIFVPLISGNCIHIYRNPDNKLLLDEILLDNQVQTVKLTPTQLGLLIEQDELKGKLTDTMDLQLERIIVGGEYFSTELASKAAQFFPKPVAIFNEYGPTEATVGCMIHKFAKADENKASVPIGKPIDNVRLYVLDESLNPVPFGVPGELYISGDSLALGYIGSEKLTNEKFIESPFVEGGKLYKTGDVVVMSPELTLEYLGRADDQVKIRGYRVEIGEIESRISQLKEIDSCAVFTKEDANGETQLHACFTAHKPVDQLTLRSELAKHLPDYMVPSMINQIDELPTTATGKVDKASLSSLAFTAEIKKPISEDEKKMFMLWANVLGNDTFGIDEDFYHIGGDSIRAIRLISKINKEFNVKIRVQDLFNNPTLESILSVVSATDEGDSLSAEREEILEEFSAYKETYLEECPDQVDVEDVFPVSDIQMGMIFHTLKDPDSTFYHDQMVHQAYYENFDIKLFTRAFDLLVRKHESMRTFFHVLSDETPVQVVLEKLEHGLDHYDLKHLEPSQQKAHIQEFLDNDLKSAFDVFKAPLWRMATFTINENEIVIVWVLHHSILDGWSDSAFKAELNEVYLELVKNHEYEPATLKTSYKHYVLDETLNRRHVDEHQDFWKKELEGLEKSEIEVKAGETSDEEPRTHMLRKLSPEFVEKLKKAEATSGISLKELCLASYLYSVYMLNSDNDILIGVIDSNRPEVEDGDKVLGCFLNALPFRHVFNANTSWETYFSDVSSKFKEVINHGKITFLDILKSIGQETSKDNSLIDYTFNFVDFHTLSTVGYDEHENKFAESLSLNSYAVNNFLLDFTFSKTLDEYRMMINYSSDVFDEQSIADFCEYFETTIDKLLDASDQNAQKVALLSDHQRDSLLDHFNATDFDYDKGKGLIEIFDEVALENGDRVALFHGDETMSYEELRIASNQVAHYLHEKEIGKEDIVGLLADRSIEMVVWMFGILKAGGAYLPINTKLPTKRISYLLEDSRAKLLVGDLKHLGDYSDILEEVDIKGSVFDEQPEDRLIIDFDLNDLMYVIYTSGSTGMPKGVMIEHASVLDLVQFLDTEYGFDQDDVVLFKAPYYFDASIGEIFTFFKGAGSLAILGEGEEKDPYKLKEAMDRYQVTQINFVPSLFHTFLDFLLVESGTLGSLKYIYSGGEALPADLVRKFHSLDTKASLLNLYGNTEYTVHTTHSNTKDWTGGPVTVGKPLGNTSIYIMDQAQNLQPIGVTGEICIAGNGIARGYLNNEQLTNERFVPNPFVPGQKMYRTGDLGRWSQAGTIEYRGRIDHQVKIRGNRVELGEIDSVLTTYEEINESIVIARKDENSTSYLSAYYTSENEISTDLLRAHLALDLPDYMIPSYFTRLEVFPLTPSGKKDIKALPSPSFENKEEHIAPSTPLEEAMSRIWSSVLGYEGISTGADFFTNGGDSIRAISLVVKINKEFNVKISVQDLFNNPTIQSICQVVSSTDKGDALSKERDEILQEFSAYKEAYLKERPDQVGVDEVFPISDIQMGMIFHTLKDPGSTFYHDQMVHQAYYKNFDIDLFSRAFDLLVGKHELLRTFFHMLSDETTVQVVLDKVDGGLVHHDIRHLEPSQQKTHIQEFLDNDLKSPFDVFKAPLWRMVTFTINDDEIVVVWVLHHAIMDGWSDSAFKAELNEVYLKLIDNPEYEPQALKTSYKQYVLEEVLNRRHVDEHEEFWKKELGGLEKSEIDLKTSETSDGVPRTPMQRKLKPDSVEKLKQIEAASGISLKELCLASYLYSIYMLNSENDILIGVIDSNRPEVEDGDKVLGCFLNVLPVRYTFGRDTSWQKYFSDVSSKFKQNLNHGKITFVDILRAVGQETGQDNSLIDYTFNFVDFHTLNTVGYREHENKFAESFSLNSHTVNNFLLDFTFSKTLDDYRFMINYSSEVFDEQSIADFCDYFEGTIDRLSDAPDQNAQKLELLSDNQKISLLDHFNASDFDYDKRKNLLTIFDEVALKNGDQVALYHGDESMTYNELRKTSNQVANYLHEKGIGKEDIVGLLADRSIELVIWMFGILKVGAAYLPINTKLPAKRVRYQLEDSHAKLLVGDANYIGEYADLLEEVDLKGKAFTEYAETEIGIEVDLKDLMYVIYTSGSTGLPKGVMVEHGSALNLIHSLNAQYSFDQGDVYLLKTPYYFDVSVSELFGFYVGGAGSLAILGQEDEKDPYSLHAAINWFEVTHINFVPSLFNSFLDVLLAESITLDHLKYVFVAGEALPADLIHKFRSLNSTASLENIYGPTEYTVYTCHYSLKDWTGGSVPIGKPIGNTSLYILDKEHNLQPIGVAGELCISGLGIARGYLNNEELTKERFVSNPFVEGQMMYKTGDLARWSESGNVEYLGRIDHQVKIRGNRVELGEIESVLTAYRGINESLVIAKEDDNATHYLSAYYTSEDEIDAELLRAHLALDLPDYMIPSYFTRLDVFPLSASGKKDIAALPSPFLEDKEEHHAPSTPVEEVMSRVWSSVLGREGLSTRSNFFTIGGDSIMSIQIMSRLRREGYRVSMKDILAHPTIAGLSLCVEKVGEVQDQRTITGEVPLSPIQHHFFEHYGPHEDHNHYNQSVMLFNASGLDRAVLQEMLEKLHVHHDALRMQYEWIDGTAVQRNAGLNYPVSLEEYDLRGVTDGLQVMSEKIEASQGSIDITSGPLMKSTLFHLEDGDRLFLTVHHLVIDGVSWRILFEDLQLMLDQHDRGETLSLPLKSSSYQSWSQYLRAYAESSEFEQEQSYWSVMDNLSISKLPTDKEGEPGSLSDYDKETISLDKELTTALLSNAHEAYGTEINDLLLTGLAMSMSEVFSADEFLLTLEGHGREQLLEGVDISRTVGWFTSMYPVRLSLQGSEVSAQIKGIKEQLRQVPNKGVGYGIYKYLSAGNAGEYARPQISFNYLGQFGQDVSGAHFELAKESTGLTQSLNLPGEHVLDVSAIIESDELMIEVSYCKDLFHAETIQEQLTSYSAHLRSIVEVCSGVSSREYTPSDFMYKGLTFEQLHQIQENYEVEEIYSMSPMQEGMLFSSLLDSESSAYFEQFAYQVDGKLEIPLIRQSLIHLTSRHEILRTAFVHEGLDQPLQVLLKSRSIDLVFEDIRGGTDHEDFIRLFKLEDRSKTFDLSQDALMRVHIFQLTDDSYEFIWSHHHILMDGWCMSIIIEDFMEVYKSLLHGRSASLGPVVPYRNYITWLSEQNKEQGKQYWKNYLAGYDLQLEIPGKLTETTDEFIQIEQVYELDAAQSSGLNKLANAYQATLSSVIHALWGTLLSKYNNELDVTFGSVVSGRPSELSDVEHILGLFINTIPVRMDLEGQTFKSLVKGVQSAILDSEAYHHVPLHEIQSQSELKNDLIDHILVFENYPLTQELTEAASQQSEQTGFSISSAEIYEQTNYDLTVNIELGEPIRFVVALNSARYQSSMIDRLMTHLFHLIDQMLAEPAREVSKLTVSTEEEQVEILKTFNDTFYDLSQEETFVSLFKTQVEKTPLKIAAEHNGEQLTYKDLYVRASKLSSCLQSGSLGRNKHVALYMPRSIDMLSSILAVFQAGGAYVPIDVNYPEDRVTEILSNSEAEVVIIHSELAEKTGAIQSSLPTLKRVLVIDELDLEPFDTVTSVTASPQDLSYIIYTSGTTGKPKGVMIHQLGMVNHLYAKINDLAISSDDVVAQTASPCFDISVWQFLAALLVGGKTYIIDNEKVLEPEELIAELQEGEVSIFESVPSLITTFLDGLPQGQNDLLTDLRWMIPTGEALSVALVKKWYAYFPNIKLLNAYGPTEASDDVTHYVVPPVEENQHTVSIGKPVQNTHIYVLDRDLNLCPVGVAGEICVAGLGVGKGYWKDEEKTQKAFIPNPFAQEIEAPGYDTLYKTGDIGYFEADGNVICLGRLDHQVKIRGNRIELGEIENVLNEAEEVVGTAVLAKGNESDIFLVAYYVSNEELDATDLRNYLLTKLPDYMIPAYFIHLNELPLTQNGKLDRKSLPDPEVKAGKDHQTPETKEEQLLADVWTTVLGIEGVGVTDNFFMIGGDSIKAIQIMSRLRREGYRVEMKDIFAHPTIAGLSLCVEKVEEQQDQRTVTGEVLLTPTQRQFFDHNGGHEGLNHYNQSVLMYSASGFDEALLREMLEKLHAHHDALRMRYVIDGGAVTQYNEGLDYPISLEEHDLRGLPDSLQVMEEKITAYQGTTDLSTGPLMNSVLFHLGDGDRLFLTVHHLVMDGVSWRILFEDLQLMFDQHDQGESLSLPLKSSSYQSWSQQLQTYAQSSDFEQEKSYWSMMDNLSVTPLHTDKSGERGTLSDYDEESIVLDKELTASLLSEVHEAYGTEINDLLLTGLARSISEVFSTEEFMLTLEGHGREQFLPGLDISRTVGWFTSMYPVHLSLQGLHEVPDQIKGIKEQLRKVPNKGVGYGIYKFLSEGNNGNVSTPEIIFNYLGQFSQDVSGDHFELAKESTGPAHSPNLPGEHALDVSAIIEADELKIVVSYSKHLYHAQTISKQLASYEEHLRSIVSACLAVSTREFTPSDYMYKGLSFSQLSQIKESYDVEEIYALSPMQEGMLFNSLLDSESSAYFEQVSYQVDGQLDISLIRKSLDQLAERHEILRTAFVHEGLEQPLQVLLKSSSVDLVFEDRRGEVNHEDLIKLFKLEDRSRTFDLSHDALMRVHIFQLTDDSYAFIWSHHHILMDGWCMSIIIDDFMELYKSFLHGRSANLGPVVPYRQYISWLSEQNRETGKQYWETYLSGYDHQLEIPGKIGEITDDFVQVEQVYNLGALKSSGLNELANASQTTLSSVIHALWGTLLSKYNNELDVAFGSVVSGRPSELSGVEQILGLFINTVPVRLDLKDQTFESLVRGVQSTILDSEPYHHVPLHEIQSQSELKNDLIDHILVFENFPLTQELSDAASQQSEQTGFSISSTEVYEQTSYDLTVTIEPGEQIRFVVAVNTSVYEMTLIDRLMSHLFHLIDQVLTKPSIEVSKLRVITEPEKHEILEQFNNSDRNYPENETFQTLFEQQVLACANETALVFEGAKMNYGDLNKRANQIAHYLRAKGIKTNDIVGILSDRSLDMVVGVLGILKSGAAYLPIDPSYPPNRIKYFLENSRSSIVLVNADLHGISEFGGDLIRLNDPDILDQSEQNPEIINVAEDLAYMIYTSGSTGNPKGVMVQHQQYLNVTYAWRESYQLRDIPVNLLQMASFSFDVFAGDMSRSLLNGGKMVICPEDIRLDPESLYNIMETESISLLESTPSLIIPLMHYIKSNDLKTDFLKLVILGSDICKVEDFKSLMDDFGRSMRIVNSYGVTEATIDTSYYEESLENIPKTGYVPIGKPLGNMEFLILDNDLNLLPTEVVGDLYIAGAGVALGYFGKEELTRERFINHPLDTGMRLYKTGDLGRWTRDGNMEFQGRSDDQVKIRGFRIELGEIESALLQIEEIDEVIVSVRKEADGTKFLCGYYMSNSTLQESDIIESLRESLPDYMIPFFYVHLDEFPLTPNGKIDIRNLPAPSMESKSDYMPPSNDVESTILNAWSEVLSRSADKISTKDNFFEIGGDSMKTMQLRTRLNQSLGQSMAIATFFEYPTIASFAEFINFEKELEQNQEQSLDVIEEESLNTLNEMLNLMDND